MKDCSIQITHRPGDLAWVADALAYLTDVLDDLVEIAFVCDSPKRAKKVLEEF